VAARWAHRLSGTAVDTTLELPGGRVLDSAAIGAVFNRARYVVSPPFPDHVDREYAVMELFALLLAWLSGLRCPVINPPSPRGLGGRERSLVEWLRLAGLAGLPVRHVVLATNGRRAQRRGMDAYVPVAYDDSVIGEPLHHAVPPGPRPVVLAEPVGAARRVVVTGGRVWGAPHPMGAGARRLSEAVRSPVLEIEVAPRLSDGVSVVCGASSFPAALADDETEALAGILATTASGAEP
jgi:hypothetical protein